MPDERENGLDLLVEEVMALAASLRGSVRAVPGSQQLSLPKRLVLKLLREHPEGLTVPQIARERGTSRQNIQVLVGSLEEAGLVASVENPDHRTSERLQLTPVGLSALARANRRQAVSMAPLLSQVTGSELHSCRAVLERMRLALGGRLRVRSERSVKTRRPKPRGARGGTAPVASVAQDTASVEDVGPQVSAPEELPVSLL